MDKDTEIIYYCKQGDVYCQSPHCRCNTINPKYLKNEPNKTKTIL